MKKIGKKSILRDSISPPAPGRKKYRKLTGWEDHIVTVAPAVSR